MTIENAAEWCRQQGFKPGDVLRLTPPPKKTAFEIGWHWADISAYNGRYEWFFNSGVPFDIVITAIGETMILAKRRGQEESFSARVLNEFSGIAKNDCDNRSVVPA